MASSKGAHADLLTGPIGPALLRMTGPNAIGLLAILFFGVVDTMWVGRLGDRELAAMAFAFPVTFLALAIPIGLSIAMMSGASRAIGGGGRAGVRRLVTDVMGLTIVLMLIVGNVLAEVIEPLFRALGAEEELLPLISSYIVPYLRGICLLSIAMVGNGALRATGDARSPAWIMGIIGVVNAVLDPFLIFGIGPFPALGLQGAALATVFAWALAVVAEFVLLSRVHDLLDFSPPSWGGAVDSWRRTLYVALPASASTMVSPVSVAVITRFMSEHGHEAVAGFGVGGRVEMLAMTGSLAMSISLAPLVGQSMGAHRLDRVRTAMRYSYRFAWIYGAGVVVVLSLLAFPLASVFSASGTVADVARSYFWIVPIGYAPYAMCQFVEAAYNALNQPLRASLLVLFRLVVVALTLAYVMGKLWGLVGILAAIPIAHGVGALVGVTSLRVYLREFEPAPGKAPVAVKGA